MRLLLLPLFCGNLVNRNALLQVLLAVLLTGD